MQNKKRKKILFIYTDWANNEYRKEHNAYGGVGYYRIAKPAQFLRKWYDVDIVGKDFQDFGPTVGEAWTKIFTTYDLVWCKQVDNPEAASAMFFFANKYQKPVVLDIDDNYFEVKPDQPGYRYYHPGSQHRAIFGASLSLASALSLSTRPLADYYFDRIKSIHKEEKPVFLLPNCVDPNDWDWPTPDKDPKKFVIGWAGSITHNADLKLITQALRVIMEKNPNVYVEFLGGVEKDKAGDIFSNFSDKLLERISISGGTPSWNGYPELLSKQNWDVGLCPLVDDEFNRGKSHIKWMEYSLCKIPTIASKTYPYHKQIQKTPTIIHGETGLLCSTTEDWIKNLQLLIDNDKMKMQLRDNAYNYVVDKWHLKKHIKKWRKVIDSLI